MTAPNQMKHPHRIFLTGEPGSGKTTILKRTAELFEVHGFKVGGMATQEIREKGARKGFSIENLATHEEGVLARIGSVGGPRIGRYTVNLHDLDEVGAAAILRAIEDADVILVDELGPMELHSNRFIQSVEAALNSKKHLVATIHKRTNHSLVMAVKSNPTYTILDVTAQNREELPTQIVGRISRRD